MPPTPPAEWERRITLDDGYLTAHDVAVDSQGRIVVVGHFMGTLRVSDVELTSVSHSIDGTIYPSNAFVFVFDRSGRHVWSRRFGDTGMTMAESVAIGPDDEIIIAGDAYGDLNLGGGALPPGGDSDVFIAGFHRDGSYRWSRRMGDDQLQHGPRIAIDTDGTVYLTAFFYGSVDAGGGAIGSDDGNSVVAAYDAGGTHLWSRGLGRKGPIVGDLAVKSGEVVIAGNFAVPMLGMRNVGLRDLFVVAMVSDQVLWTRRFGDERLSGHSIFDIELDPHGDIFLIGHFDDKLTLGDNTLQGGKTTVFVARLDEEGSPVWSRAFGNRGVSRSRLALHGATAHAAFTLVDLDDNAEDPVRTYRVALSQGGKLVTERRQHPHRDFAGLAYDATHQMPVAVRNAVRARPTYVTVTRGYDRGSSTMIRPR